MFNASCGQAAMDHFRDTHFRLSMQMAELALLPAVRQVPDPVIVADGTRCRHQIADGVQPQALHAARLLASLLTD